MYIVIGIVALVLLVIIIKALIGGKTYHTVRLKPGNGLVYSDNDLEIEFFKGQAENSRIDFYSNRGINIKLRNKTNTSISIKWDSCLFIYPDGKSVELVAAKTPIGATRKISSDPMPVAANSYVEAFACPKDKFVADVGRLHEPIFLGGEPETKAEFRCVLPIKLANEVKPYEFCFIVEKQV